MQRSLPAINNPIALEKPVLKPSLISNPLPERDSEASTFIPANLKVSGIFHYAHKKSPDPQGTRANFYNVER